MSRQRRSLSCSWTSASGAIGCPSQDLGENGEHSRRPVHVDLLRLSRSRSGCRRRGAEMFHLLPHPPPLGGLEGGEGPPQQGEELGESVWGKLREPAVERGPEAVVMQEEQTASPQQSRQPGGGVSGRHGGRESQAGPCFQLPGAQHLLIEEEPAGVAADQSVGASRGESLQSFGPL